MIPVNLVGRSRADRVMDSCLMKQNTIHASSDNSVAEHVANPAIPIKKTEIKRTNIRDSLVRLRPLLTNNKTSIRAIKLLIQLLKSDINHECKHELPPILNEICRVGFHDIQTNNLLAELGDIIYTIQWQDVGIQKWILYFVDPLLKIRSKLFSDDQFYFTKALNALDSLSKDYGTHIKNSQIESKQTEKNINEEVTFIEILQNDAELNNLRLEAIMKCIETVYIRHRETWAASHVESFLNSLYKTKKERSFGDANDARIREWQISVSENRRSGGENKGD